MVTVTKHQLKQAFHTHKSLAARGNTPSHKLLLFYAAECGIKSYYLKINSLPDTKIADLGTKYGHKISKLVKDCSLPGFALSEPNHDNGNFPIKDLHEHLRYGSILPDAVLISQQMYLQNLIRVVEKHI